MGNYGVVRGVLVAGCLVLGCPGILSAGEPDVQGGQDGVNTEKAERTGAPGASTLDASAPAEAGPAEVGSPAGSDAPPVGGEVGETSKPGTPDADFVAESGSPEEAQSTGAGEAGVDAEPTAGDSENGGQVPQDEETSGSGQASTGRDSKKKHKKKRRPPRPWTEAIAITFYRGLGQFPDYQVEQTQVTAAPDTGHSYAYPSTSILAKGFTVTWYRKGTLGRFASGGLVHGAGTMAYDGSSDVRDRYLEITSGLFWASRRRLITNLQVGVGMHARAIQVPTVTGFYDPPTSPADAAVNALIDLTMSALFGGCFSYTNKRDSQIAMGGSVRGFMPHVSAHWEFDVKPKHTRGPFAGLYADARYDLMTLEGDTTVRMTDLEYDVTWDERWHFTSGRFMFALGVVGGVIF